MATPAEQRTVGAIALYALGRWQTAVVVLIACVGIAGTIVALGANPWLIAAWVAFGLIGVLGMVVVSFRDQRSIDEALAPQIPIDQLKTPELREAVRRAIEYRNAIRDAVAALPSPDTRASLELITRQFDDPALLIFNLGLSVERFRNDRLIQTDLQRLRALNRAGRLTDADREHLDRLERLESLIGEAGGKINGMLAQLGSSYAEVQTIGAAGEIRGARTQHALDEVADRANELTQLTKALEEVYAEER
jgi:hypothetical protein